MKTEDIKKMAQAWKQVQEASKLDPVNQAELKGTHAQRKDKDIDNDGDVDKSDEYLHNRRKTVKQAMNKEAKDYGPGHIGAVQKMLDKERDAKKAKDAMKKEEVEELDEISRDTARSYIRKASAHKTTGETPKKDRSSGVELAGKKAYGIGGKAKVMAKESVDLDEKYKDPWAAPRKGSSAWHAAQQRKKAERDPEEVKRVNAIGNKNHMVGTAKITHNEAVEVSHDRYMRSHGKKASGGHGMWMFTHKRMGDVDYNDSKEVHSARGKFSDAKKSAQQWAKKHGHSTVYVMEEVELDEVSDKKLDAYRQKAFADQPAGDDGSDKYRKRKFGRDLAFAKQTGRAKVLATKESVELDEDIKKMSDSRLKWHMNTGVPHGSYTKDEMKKERDRRLSRVDTHAAYKKAKPMLEAADLNTANADKAVRHDCATHVEHAEWGKGQPIKGEHTIVETADGEGYVTHYDVMFEHGIEKNVAVEDLKILASESHMHANKRKKMKESNEWPVYARILEKRDAHTKGATAAEPIDSKASQGEKDFVAKHGGLDGNDSGIDGAKAAEATAKAATAGVKTAPKRPADATIGDKTMPKA